VHCNEILKKEFLKRKLEFLGEEGDEDQT